MSVGKKTISFSLSEKGIDQALKELEVYKQELKRKTLLLREKIAKRLAEEAQRGFQDAVVDDLIHENPKPAQVVVTVDNRGDLTVVIADGEDAVWVEFGTGVYHNGSAGSSPHPSGTELGMTIGGYGKGYGNRKVWGYYEDGELHKTHGTPAAMPMAKAVTAVCDALPELVKEVFG